VQLAHRLVDEAGVNILIGHHPHVLQAVERYRDAVIVYSLGNFVFDMWSRNARESMAFTATLTKSDKISYRLIPLWINEDCQPEPVLSETGMKQFLEESVRLKMLLEQNCLSRDLSDPNLVDRLEANYIRLVRRKEIAHRISSYFYFARNIYRYEPSIVRQSLLRSASRRAENIYRLDTKV
jgi:poly-gamma-glutamate synthesis protein (capsule biosynthesis protein)